MSLDFGSSPLYHPSHVLQNGGLSSIKGKEFIEDFKKIREKWKPGELQ
jgi:hypothetical protein